MSTELREGLYVWQITETKTIEKIENIEPGERLDSEIFEISGAKWFLRLFPNGTKKKYAGRVSLFLQLCALPANVGKLKIKLVLSCDETNTQYSDIKYFSEDREFGGWTGGILNTDQLRKHQKLTFRVSITVIAKELMNAPSTAHRSTNSLTNAAEVPLPRIRSPLSHGHAHRKTHSVKNLMHSTGGIDPAELFGASYANNGYSLAHGNSFDDELKYNRLEAMDIRLNALCLNVMNLTQSLKQIHDYVQMINTKIDNNYDKLVSQQKQEQNSQLQQEYSMSSLKRDLAKIQSKLGIQMASEEQQDTMPDEEDEVQSNGDQAHEDEYDQRFALKAWFQNQVKLGQYFDVFVENGLEDMQIVSDLTDNELNLIGVTKLGHRKKILSEIQKYKQSISHESQISIRHEDELMNGDQEMSSVHSSHHSKHSKLLEKDDDENKVTDVEQPRMKANEAN